jgi:hypothetical protein
MTKARITTTFGRVTSWNGSRVANRLNRCLSLFTKIYHGRLRVSQETSLRENNLRTCDILEWDQGFQKESFLLDCPCLGLSWLLLPMASEPTLSCAEPEPAAGSREPQWSWHRRNSWSVQQGLDHQRTWGLSLFTKIYPKAFSYFHGLFEFCPS